MIEQCIGRFSQLRNVVEFCYPVIIINVLITMYSLTLSTQSRLAPLSSNVSTIDRSPFSIAQ